MANPVVPSLFSSFIDSETLGIGKHLTQTQVRGGAPHTSLPSCLATH